MNGGTDVIRDTTFERIIEPLALNDHQECVASPFIHGQHGIGTDNRIQPDTDSHRVIPAILDIVDGVAAVGCPWNRAAVISPLISQIRAGSNDVESHRVTLINFLTERLRDDCRWRPVDQHRGFFRDRNGAETAAGIAVQAIGDASPNHHRAIGFQRRAMRPACRDCQNVAQPCHPHWRCMVVRRSVTNLAV